MSECAGDKIVILNKQVLIVICLVKGASYGAANVAG